VIQARDAGGQPVKNLPLHLDISSGSVIADIGALSSKDVVTGADGRASVSYTAPRASVGTGTSTNVVTLLVTPVGSDYAGSTARSVDIKLVPQGIIPLPPSATPEASFFYSPTTPTTLMAVNFDGSDSKPGGSLVAWAWEFGDGTTGSGRTVAHAYGAEGAYVAKLTVTDDHGQTASLTKSLTVTAAAPLVASFTIAPASPAVGQLVSFNAAASSTMPGQTITKYEWDFGLGGGSGVGQFVQYPYFAAGTYAVTLQITDSLGRKAWATNTVAVK
jgi:PKD repeat protein